MTTGHIRPPHLTLDKALAFRHPPYVDQRVHSTFIYIRSQVTFPAVDVYSSCSNAGMSDLSDKWARLAPSGTNVGHFKDQFSVYYGSPTKKQILSY